MQEVTIKKRDFFTHYVHVETAGKELCWNFYTKKKNVSFGLFRQIDAVSASKPVKMLLSTGNGVVSEVSASATSPSLAVQQNNGRLSSTSIGSGADVRASTASKGKRRVEPPGCIPIMPIAHYDSAKVTIKGGHFVQEPGTYVLVFDNTFSVKTSKKLFFFVALRDIEPREIVNRKEIEGWLLKKGKRTMQGYQRRWLEVHSSGVLTYYRAPGGSSHGSINLMTCAIRLNHDHLLIDIDSDQSTLHFKVETEKEFERWTSLFEKFSHALMRAASEGGLSNTAPTSDDLLNSDRNSFRESAGGSSFISLNTNLEHLQDKAGIITITLKTELSKMKELIDASKGRIDTKSQWKDFAQILGGLHEMTSGLIISSSQLEEQLKIVASGLKKEKLLHTNFTTDAAFQACLADNNKVRAKFGLEQVSASKFNGDSYQTDEKRSIISYNRTDDVFFDAEDGLEESDDSSGNYSIQNLLIIDEDSGDEASRMSSLQAIDVASQQQTQDMFKTAKSPTEPQSPSSTTASSTPFNTSTKSIEKSRKKSTNALSRRIALPAESSSMENVSIMGILRNNVGKDLSTVAMPIVLNEPINLLQKLCEELEYCYLLDKASAITDSYERLAMVAGFVVAGYSSTIHRAARKPFNPLLGETFEFDRPDLGFRYVSEKVSHHPPIMACHAISKNYLYYQDSLPKTKFWGKSMELNNIGVVHLEFPALQEHYIWQKVTTSMRNVFSAGRYLEHHGTITIKSKTTGDYCELLFKESGYFSSANNEVVGGVYDSKGTKIFSLSGRWDHSMNKFSDSNPNSLEVLWRAHTFPSNYAENYGFTKFAIELNELTPDCSDLIPRTDTRYRPDQRLYEEGKVDAAEQEKVRLEQKQREFRKRLEAAETPWTPQYFKKIEDADSPHGVSWVYNDKYWDHRGKWSADEKALDIF